MFLLILVVSCSGENPDWKVIIEHQIVRWKGMVRNLVLNPNHQPVLVVRYEDLKANSTHEVLRMLDFLRVEHDSRQVAAVLEKEGFIEHYRNHTDDFEHFTAKQKQFINNAIRQMLKELQQAKIPDTLGLKNYIRL